MRDFNVGSRLFAGWLAVAALGLGHAGDASALLVWRFAGTGPLAGDTNGAACRAALTEASSQAVIERAFAGLARAAARNAEGATRVRSLMDDWLRVPSHGLFRCDPNGDNATWLLAGRLGSESATRWSAAWAALADDVGMPQANARVSGEWFLGGLSRGPAPDLVPLLEWIEQTPRAVRAEGAWLELEVDLARCAALWAWPESIPWPRAQLTLAGRGTVLRTTVRLEFAQPDGGVWEEWNVPTNTIRDPLLSFTALQGVQPWLAAQPLWKELGFSTPNQVFGWAQSQAPYLTHLAWPMPDAEAQIKGALPRIIPAFQHRFPWLDFGQVELLSGRLVWRGFPIIVPFLNPAQDPGFAVAGIFPLSNPQEPAPPELFTQLQGRTNLIYYDWELTQPRASDWDALSSLYTMMAGQAPPATNSLALRWLQDTNVTRHLGNCVTEITRTSPREWAAVRSSAVGFTAFELNRILHWIAGEKFPRSTPPRQLVVFPSSSGGTNAPAEAP
jgi:hypothetical protein